MDIFLQQTGKRVLQERRPADRETTETGKTGYGETQLHDVNDVLKQTEPRTNVLHCVQSVYGRNRLSKSIKSLSSSMSA